MLEMMSIWVPSPMTIIIPLRDRTLILMVRLMTSVQWVHFHLLI